MRTGRTVVSAILIQQPCMIVAAKAGTTVLARLLPGIAKSLGQPHTPHKKTDPCQPQSGNRPVPESCRSSLFCSSACLPGSRSLRMATKVFSLFPLCASVRPSVTAKLAIIRLSTIGLQNRWPMHSAISSTTFQAPWRAEGKFPGDSQFYFRFESSPHFSSSPSPSRPLIS